MGLIKALMGAAGGVMADQWKEYFYCESIDKDILMVKGQKRTSNKGRSSNTKGTDNIISSGSVIAVADGQCMIIVDQGKVAELCAEPGEFVYDSSTEPSIFNGKLGKGIIDTFKNIGKRFTFGGDAPKDQRVYYFNTKEIIGNKYGTANGVPFRVVDNNIHLDVDISIKCFGEYSYKIVDPILFYTNVCGNVKDEYPRNLLDSQLKSELLTALQPAFARISEMGIRYSALPGHTEDIADALNEVLDKKWRERRGIEVAAFGVSSVKASEEDEKLIKDAQRAAINRDPGMAAATYTTATADAMRGAANNPNGAMMGFAGMGMAMNAAGNNAASLFAMQQQQQQMQPQQQPQMAQQGAGAAAGGWTCSCGAVNTGKFCSSCGKPKPIAAAGWTCSCGAVNTGKFCAECGKPKPAGEWTCSCGAVNKGKFCSSCGSPRP